MIAVTFALPAESSAFIHLLQNRTRGAAGSHTIAGTLHDHALCVLHTGVGQRTTRGRLADFLHRETPRLLVSSGFAGALHEEWRVGDVLLAENFSSARLDFPASVNYRPGKLVTAPAVIDSLAERQTLAQAGADAVDMETECIAAACAAANVPMVSLRVISDTPAAPFPAPAHVLFDLERQRTTVVPLVTHLLLHPTSIARFIRFARRMEDARQILARALDALILSVPRQT